jgi:hypothetical protein
MLLWASGQDDRVRDGEIKFYRYGTRRTITIRITRLWESFTDT